MSHAESATTQLCTLSQFQDQVNSSEILQPDGRGERDLANPILVFKAAVQRGPTSLLCSKESGFAQRAFLPLPSALGDHLCPPTGVSSFRTRAGYMNLKESSAAPDNLSGGGGHARKTNHVT